MFRNILCAVDGSQHGLRAARTAAGLAAKLDASLVFLTVTKHIEVNDAVRRYMQLEHLTGGPQYVLDEMTEQVLGEAQRTAIENGVHGARAVVRVGSPARAIAAFAKEIGADLIVLGRRGLGDVGGALLGSVSHKVASLSDCTVMTVK